MYKNQKSDGVGRKVTLGKCNKSGFTIIELMVAMAVASVVAMAGFALFHNSNWSYQTQEDVGEAQQNARIAMDRIISDIRTAGFGLPEPPFSISPGGMSWISKIVASDGGDGDPDSIALVGLGHEAATLKKNGASDCNKRTDPIICVSSLEDFRNDSNAFIISRKYISLDGIKFLELQGSQPDIGSTSAPYKLHLVNRLDKDYVDGVTVYILHVVEYLIDKNSPTSDPPCTEETPCLKSKDHSDLRGSGRQLVAENIEDLQFAYTAGGTTYVDSPANGNEVSAIRISLVAKTRRKDRLGFESVRPALENHTGGGERDNFRRRTITRIVKVRN